MVKPSRNLSVLALGLAVAVTVGFAPQAKLLKVFIEGKLVSSSARVIDGKVYVPVDEVLKPFDYKGVQTNAGVNLVPISGVQQRDGAPGAMSVWVQGKLAKLRVDSIGSVESYGDQYWEIKGKLQTAVAATFSLGAAVLVYADGKQEGYSLSAAEMAGGSYMALQKAETGEMVIQFKKNGEVKPERVVITIKRNDSDVEDVYRIRLTE